MKQESFDAQVLKAKKQGMTIRQMAEHFKCSRGKIAYTLKKCETPKTEFQKLLPKRAITALYRMGIYDKADLMRYVRANHGSMYGIQSQKGIGEGTFKIIKQVFEESQEDFQMLPITLRGALRRNGIYNKAELIAYYEKHGADGIMNLRNIGEKSIPMLEELVGFPMVETEEQNKPLDVNAEIEKLTRIKAKIEAQIQRLRRRDIAYAIFKAYALKDEDGEDTYEVCIKILINGRIEEFTILKAPTIAGVENQLVSFRNDVESLLNLIRRDWGDDGVLM